MIKGISLGIGITIGVIATILIIGLIGLIIFLLYKQSMRRKFTVDLFLNYHKELMRHEKFEELNQVNSIIEKLKNKEKPKEMYQNYKVDVNSYWYWGQTYDGGERLYFRHDKRIKRKQ